MPGELRHSMQTHEISPDFLEAGAKSPTKPRFTRFCRASKLYVLKCAAYNLGLLVRKVWGLIKPRGLVRVGAAVGLVCFALLSAWVAPRCAVLAITLIVAVLLHRFHRASRQVAPNQTTSLL